MSNSSQIREGIRAGLIRAEFTAPTEPRDYSVSVTNGSGTRSTVITSSTQTSAALWAGQWAASLGPAWYVNDVTSGR
jgi:hypothetical protein